MTTVAQASPVSGDERIGALDLLRGVAVLGILPVNMQSFAMVTAAYTNPTAYGDLTGVHRAVWLVTHVLFDQKFMTIFSLLFGAGIVLMTERIESRNLPAAGPYYRRTIWLIVIGLLHAHLLWFGDVLVFYGLCGLVLYPFRKLPASWLVPLGLATISVASLLSLLFGLTMPYWGEEELAQFAEDWKPPPDVIEEELATYRGGWLEQMTERPKMALMFETFLFLIWGGWRAGGLMLLGMAAYKRGLLQGRAQPRSYVTMVALGFAVGLPVVLYGVWRNFAAGWSVDYSFFFGGQFNYWGSLLVSGGWIGGILLWSRTTLLAGLQGALAAVGRMALTNYLMQTVLCTTLFYGHGFGLFGYLARAEQAAIVVSIWIAQLVLSPLWLARFRFGPAEWLWRALTYGHLPPLRREPRTV